MAAGEAVIEELSEKLLVLGERHQAVADIAGRKHAEIPPQAAGTSALISHGYDSGEAGNLRLNWAGRAGSDDVVLQSAENRR